MYVRVVVQVTRGERAERNDLRGVQTNDRQQQEQTTRVKWLMNERIEGGGEGANQTKPNKTKEQTNSEYRIE